MSKRRDLLKVMSVAGAAGVVWKKPVVDSISLPAHAQTSCGLPNGCYEIFSDMFVSWPGGAGPIPGHAIFSDPACGNQSGTSGNPLVVADSQISAAAALIAADIDFNLVFETLVQPPELGDCIIYTTN